MDVESRWSVRSDSFRFHLVPHSSGAWARRANEANAEEALKSGEVRQWHQDLTPQVPPHPFPADPDLPGKDLWCEASVLQGVVDTYCDGMLPLGGLAQVAVGGVDVIEPLHFEVLPEAPGVGEEVLWAATHHMAHTFRRWSFFDHRLTHFDHRRSKNDHRSRETHHETLNLLHGRLMQTDLTSLTRGVLRRGDRPVPQAPPESAFSAGDRDRIRPRLSTQDGLKGRVIDLGAYRRRADRVVADGLVEIEDVVPYGLVDGIRDGGHRPVLTDLDRPQPLSAPHGARLANKARGFSGAAPLVTPDCYTGRSYDQMQQEVGVDVASYSPDGMEPWEWDRIAAFVRQTTLTAQKHHSGRYQTKDMIGAVATFTWWVTEVACYPMETSVVFHRDTITDYIDTGCDSLTPGTRATRRAMLLRVAEAVLDLEERVERLAPVHKDNPLRPYSEFEQRQLLSWAEGQTTPTRRLDCHLILALGLGAGLSSPDILSLTAGQVVVDHLGALIRVQRRGAERDVPVLAAWEQPIVDAVSMREPDGWLVGTRRGENSNWINHFLAKTQPEAGRRPNVSRLRITWIVHHLNTGTPLGPLSVAAGLKTFRTIEKLLPFVHAPSQDEVRRSMRRALRVV